MKKHSLQIASLSLALPLLLAGCTTTTNASSTASGSPHPQAWSYSGPAGPKSWGEISAACSTGTAQSPIELTRSMLNVADVGAPEVHYQPTVFEVENNGHTIEVTPENETDNYMVLGGETYYLQQFHLHSTSEHTIDGVRSDLELHLVNKTTSGKVAVLAVLFNAGAANTALANFFAEMPQKVTGEEESDPVSGTINPAELLPADSKIIQYEGSLTTPPCSEGVHWNVYETPGEISTTQLSAFEKLYPHNSRPLQKINDRTGTEITTP
ncbi:carbonic anhydrase [Mycetocola sp. JXN-3]|uniref:carbonic anhydrase n=1 Tax=Mycetocola sp. JXN-3 TaxID=2116510 RepID=UPI00165D23B2|nr:carbonic anhydrase family protein [Mycetocola sp. JXN-3]